MIQIDHTVISPDLFEERFVCDLQTCKGICCVEGDAGAPLEEEEIQIIEKILPIIEKDIPEKSKKIIQQQGVYYIDEDNEPVTSIVDGRECVFAYKDENQIYKCAIEKAYREGLITFQKPISCYLYPVRLQQYRDFLAVNVHRWEVCDCARIFGKKLKVPVYKFLKEPLTTKFGAEWYEKIEIAAKELPHSHSF